MPITTSPPPLRMKRLSLGIQLLCVVGALGLLQYLLLLVWDPSPLAAGLLAGLEQQTIHPPDRWDTQALRGLAVALPSLVSLAELWLLFRLFGRYRQGLVFDLGSVRLLQFLGHGLWMLALARPISHTLMVLAYTLQNPPGQRQLVLSVSTDHYTLLLMGLLLVAISRVMQESVRLARENAEFV